jgi:hypothetical protein
MIGDSTERRPNDGHRLPTVANLRGKALLSGIDGLSALDNVSLGSRFPRLEPFIFEPSTIPQTCPLHSTTEKGTGFRPILALHNAVLHRNKQGLRPGDSIQRKCHGHQIATGHSRRNHVELKQPHLIGCKTIVGE